MMQAIFEYWCDVAGDLEYWHMFESAYTAVMRHYRMGLPWYHDADIRTGRPTQLQFTSLQAFWPGGLSQFASTSSSH